MEKTRGTKSGQHCRKTFSINRGILRGRAQRKNPNADPMEHKKEAQPAKQGEPVASNGANGGKKSRLVAKGGYLSRKGPKMLEGEWGKRGQKTQRGIPE